ncbi:MAG TPA: TonB-dependent receptor plug domain-containing protein, partial [Tenuifilaceae bacterium]|nr:TonB-dependent receptor plug domain-containing protein [Tenuifilaceae bacterium]
MKETPVLTQLVSRKDISGIKATTVNDILEMEIPSVEMNLHGYGAALSSQGLEGKYTLVLIDGERMAGENDGNVDFSRINAANIEQVEIVKGASSALYGSNAIGSVINIITKKPSKK